MFKKNIKKRKIFFLHIPKTAGSSLNDMLSENFKRKKIRQHIETDRINTYKNIDPTKLDFISGHINLYDVINYFNLEDFLKITILRNPYDQLISHINWLRYIGSNPDGKFFKAHTPQIQLLALKINTCDFENIKDVELFFNNLPPLGNKFFNNCQTRFLLKKQSPEVLPEGSSREAIEALSFFNLIGTLDELDIFINKLYKKLEWKTPFEIKKTNTLNNRFNLPKESEALKEILSPLIREDQILYNYVKNKNKSLLI